ncbi:MBL fold metallo-hydrolase [Lichenibacterium ramalinae]|nr:MBL fold metallo-hydrolase [Lichenibacterium ramalinae]
MMPERVVGGDDGLSVRFWGTRGSLPMPGSDTIVYGGNTCCVEVRLGDRLFVVDAGSGFEAAGRALALLGSGSGRVDLLLSHLHHDHISGLPFFAPILKGPGELRVFCGNLGGESAAAAFGTMFAPPLFPVTLDVLPGHIAHVGFRAGETLTFEDGVSVATCPLRHPGGATAYRFDHGGRSVCYVSDMEHVDTGPDADVVAFCRGADLVIYDAMFTEAELSRCRGWGHSTWNAGVDLCRAAGAEALAAFHHHKGHDDAALAAIEAELAEALPGSFVAREGQTLTFPARRSREGGGLVSARGGRRRTGEPPEARLPGARSPAGRVKNPHFEHG